MLQSSRPKKLLGSPRANNFPLGLKNPVWYKTSFFVVFGFVSIFLLFFFFFFRHTYSSVRTTTKQSHTRLTLRQQWNNPERKSTLGLKNKLRVSWAQSQPDVFPLLLSACHSLWAGALASPRATAAARSCLLIWTVGRDAVGGQRKSST